MVNRLCFISFFFFFFLSRRVSQLACLLGKLYAIYWSNLEDVTTYLQSSGKPATEISKNAQLQMSFNWNEDECFIVSFNGRSAQASTESVVQTQDCENVLACTYLNVHSSWLIYLDAHKFCIVFQITLEAVGRILRLFKHKLQVKCVSSNVFQIHRWRT